MKETIESTIIRNLLCNEDYFRKVIPHLKKEYFSEYSDKYIFDEIYTFASKYDKPPTKEVLLLCLQDRDDVSEDIYKESISKIKSYTDDPIDKSWVIDATEKWCQERAVYNALLKAIKIADGDDDTLTKDAIPQILQESLGVSFDEYIGHDYFLNTQERYEYYHRQEEKIPFDIDKLNLITKGGLPRKTLNIFIAGTGVGKSLVMCHCAANALNLGLNVLYITLEMAEEKIAERIDSNLLDVNIKDIGNIPESIFNSRVQDIGKRTQGKLIIKEYPTASAHAGHFRALLNDLRLKKNFKPDIIFVDYLNICASSRYKGHIVNSYTYVKAIAEELRGLAVEYDIPLVSATQTTRSGFGNTDLDVTDTSESFGLPATADLMLGIISTEELEQSGRIMVKQLKNRYNDPTQYRRFTVGIDRSKMKLYNVEDSNDTSITNTSEEEVYDRFEDMSKQQSRQDKFSNFVF
jgi:replicative DNA helicase